MYRWVLGVGTLLLSFLVGPVLGDTFKIGYLVPMSDWEVEDADDANRPVGWEVAGAFSLAIDDINADNNSILRSKCTIINYNGRKLNCSKQGKCPYTGFAHVLKFDVKFR